MPKCIREGVIRHYFIPSFNLLSVKLTQEAKNELLQLYDIVIESDLNIMRQCKTLRNVWSKFLLANENQMSFIHNEKRTHLIQNDALMMKHSFYLSFALDHENNIEEINYTCSPVLNALQMDLPLLRSLLVGCFIHNSPSLAEATKQVMSIPCKTSLQSVVMKRFQLDAIIKSLASAVGTGNQNLTELQKYAFDTTSFDISTSKLWYALMLLKQCDYSSSLSIVHQVLSSIPPFALFDSAIDNFEAKDLYVDKFLTSSCTTMQRAKEAWLYSMMFTNAMTKLLPLGFQIEVYFQKPHPVRFSPYACSYYLLFLCYNELGQYENRNQALKELADIANNDQQVGSFSTSNIVGHCLLIAGEIDQARYMFIRSRLETPGPIDKFNSASWYITNFCPF